METICADGDTNTPDGTTPHQQSIDEGEDEQAVWRWRDRYVALSRCYPSHFDVSGFLQYLFKLPTNVHGLEAAQLPGELWCARKGPRLSINGYLRSDNTVSRLVHRSTERRHDDETDRGFAVVLRQGLQKISERILHTFGSPVQRPESEMVPVPPLGSPVMRRRGSSSVHAAIPVPARRARGRDTMWGSPGRSMGSPPRSTSLSPYGSPQSTSMTPLPSFALAPPSLQDEEVFRLEDTGLEEVDELDPLHVITDRVEERSLGRQRSGSRWGRRLSSRRHRSSSAGDRSEGSLFRLPMSLGRLWRTESDSFDTAGGVSEECKEEEAAAQRERERERQRQEPLKMRMLERVTETQLGSEKVVIRVNQPFPTLRQGICYFEIKVKEHSGAVGIGLCTRSFVVGRVTRPFLGWDKQSWGYHGDDGCKWHNSASSYTPYGPVFSKGDVVGCGVDWSNGVIFYTKNGEHLGVAWSGIQTRQPLYPAVGLLTSRDSVSINLGVSTPTADDGANVATSFVYRHCPERHKTLIEEFNSRTRGLAVAPPPEPEEEPRPMLLF